MLCFDHVNLTVANLNCLQIYLLPTTMQWLIGPNFQKYFKPNKLEIIIPLPNLN